MQFIQSCDHLDQACPHTVWIDKVEMNVFFNYSKHYKNILVYCLLICSISLQYIVTSKQSQRIEILKSKKIQQMNNFLKSMIKITFINNVLFSYLGPLVCICSLKKKHEIHFFHLVNLKIKLFINLGTVQGGP